MYKSYLKRGCFNWKRGFQESSKKTAVRKTNSGSVSKPQGRENVLWATSNHAVFAASLSSLGEI